MRNVLLHPNGTGRAYAEKPDARPGSLFHAGGRSSDLEIALDAQATDDLIRVAGHPDRNDAADIIRAAIIV